MVCADLLYISTYSRQLEILWLSFGQKNPKCNGNWFVVSKPMHFAGFCSWEANVLASICTRRFEIRTQIPSDKNKQNIVTMSHCAKSICLSRCREHHQLPIEYMTCSKMDVRYEKRRPTHIHRHKDGEEERTETNADDNRHIVIAYNNIR